MRKLTILIFVALFSLWGLNGLVKNYAVAQEEQTQEEQDSISKKEKAADKGEIAKGKRPKYTSQLVDCKADCDSKPTIEKLNNIEYVVCLDKEEECKDDANKPPCSCQLFEKNKNPKPTENEAEWIGLAAEGSYTVRATDENKKKVKDGTLKCWCVRSKAAGE